LVKRSWYRFEVENQEQPAVNGFGIAIRNEYICEKWVFRKGEVTITHPTVSLERFTDGVCILLTNGRSSTASERRRRFVPTFYESWKADGRVGNTVKKQKLMRASCDKVPTLMPYGQSNLRNLLILKVGL